MALLLQNRSVLGAKCRSALGVFGPRGAPPTTIVGVNGSVYYVETYTSGGKNYLLAIGTFTQAGHLVTNYIAAYCWEDQVWVGFGTGLPELPAGSTATGRITAFWIDDRLFVVINDKLFRFYGASWVEITPYTDCRGAYKSYDTTHGTLLWSFGTGLVGGTTYVYAAYSSDYGGSWTNLFYVPTASHYEAFTTPSQHRNIYQSGNLLVCVGTNLNLKILLTNMTYSMCGSIYASNPTALWQGSVGYNSNIDPNYDLVRIYLSATSYPCWNGAVHTTPRTVYSLCISGTNSALISCSSYYVYYTPSFGVSSTWTPKFTTSVADICISNGVFVVGGSFTTIGGVVFNNIATWFGDALGAIEETL